jgi:hypothetical protein
MMLRIKRLIDRARIDLFKNLELPVLISGESGTGKPLAEIFIDDVQHGYDRELGPVLIGHCVWERLNFSTILSDCGFNKRQILIIQRHRIWGY